MGTSIKDSVVVATCFSRLRDERQDATGVDLKYEALCALAESLELLSSVLDSLPNNTRVHAERLRGIDARMKRLLALLPRNPPASDAAQPTPEPERTCID